MYFIIRKNKKEGPFKLNQLTNKNISQSTLVWKEGLDDWVKASSLPELEGVIKTGPPDFEKPLSNKVANETVSFGKFMLGTLVTAIFASILFYSVEYSNYKNYGGTLDKYDSGLLPGIDRERNRKRHFEGGMKNAIPNIFLFVSGAGVVCFILYKGATWVNKNSD